MSKRKRGQKYSSPTTKSDNTDSQTDEDIYNLIDELLQNIDCSNEEAKVIHSEFKNMRGRKITHSKIVNRVKRMRLLLKIERLEKILDVEINSNNELEAMHSFPIEIDDEKFLKTFTIVSNPIDSNRLRQIKESRLVDILRRLKSDSIEKKSNVISSFIGEFSQNNPYMNLNLFKATFRSLPHDIDFEALALPTVTLQLILKKHTKCKIAIPNGNNLIIKDEANYLFFNATQLTYDISIELNSTELSALILRGDSLGIKEALAKRSRELEREFESSINRLVAGAMHASKIIGWGRDEVENSLQADILEHLNLRHSLALSSKQSRKILTIFEHKIAPIKLQKQREALLAQTIRDFKNLFPLARNMKRSLTFHVGPTNSGKTYAAFEKLKSRDSGYYLAPLRLLALEGYENLLSHGIQASLITGEEEHLDEEAAHISSTIEMLNFQVDVELCVIDEVQMISDRDRGWAWANAIIGAPAKELILTGSPDAIPAVKALAKWLDEPLNIVHFKRKNPLLLLSSATPIKEITKGSAIITFSRKSVLNLKQKLAPFFSISVIYGNLSPEVRKEEARRFREGKSDILIATDAIAMGLNLPIKTILFEKKAKFDGERDRLLRASEIQQVSGRAGRFGLHEKGYVGALHADVLSHIREEFALTPESIEPPFNVMASLEHVKLVSSILNTKNLTEVLDFFVKNMKFDGPFRAAKLEQMLEISKLVDTYNLELEQRYYLATAPVSLSSASIAAEFENYIRAIASEKQIRYTMPKNINNQALTMQELLSAEERVKIISLYLWLSFRFKELFVDTQSALQARALYNSFIEKSLEQKRFARACRNCGVLLSETLKYAICEECFKKQRRRPESNKWQKRRAKKVGYA